MGPSILCLLLVFGTAHAEPQGSMLSGTVKSFGRPIPGATVTSTQPGNRATAVTDEDGRFALTLSPNIPAILEVSIFGFDTQRVDVKAEDIGKPVSLTLSLSAFRSSARSGPNGGRQGFQNLELVRNLESQVNLALEASPGNGAANLADQHSTEAFLVQGSVSQGLQQAEGPAQFAAGLMMGMGGPGGPGFGGGETQQAPAGFGQGVGGGMSGGGMGPGGGGFSGGPGGGRGGGGFGGGPGGGMRPGGGPPGGPGGERLAQMTPEDREKLGREFRERLAQRNNREFFGNRSQNNRGGIRGGLNFDFRNSALDAAPYSLNGQSVDKPSYSQYQFGASLGGTLRIPKLLKTDRTFFFLNYNGSRSRNVFSSYASMPGAGERSGDFSQTNVRGPVTVYDPLSQLPFPGNRIPASRFDNAASGLMSLMPLPNQPGGTQNYRILTSVPREQDTLMLRLNHSLSRADRLSVGMNLQRRTGETVQLFGFRDPTDGSGQNYDVTWNHNFTPRLIYNVRVQYNQNRNQTVPYFAYGQDVSGMLGIQGNSRDPVNYGPPNLNFTNYGDLTDSGHLLRRIHTFTTSQGATIVRGPHTFRTGFEVRRGRWNSVAEQNARGSFTFSGLATSGFDSSGLALKGTGFDFADFLLGFPQQSTIRYNGADTYLRYWATSAFGQDEWRVRPNLTLNLGLRYEYVDPFREKYGRMANLDINSTVTEVAVVTPGAVGPFTGQFPQGLINPDKNNIAPRLGLAWRPRPKGKTLLRAGYSIFFDGTVYNRIPTQLAAQPPFATSSTFNTSITNPLTIENGFIGPADVNVTNTYAVNRNYPLPYAQTWNFAVQREFPQSFFVEVGYLGTKGTRLVIQRLPNRAPPGSSLTSEDRRRIGNAVGFTYDSPMGNSIFHAAQIRASRRLRRGVSFNALYTFSKSIDNASSIGGAGSTVVQDERNLAAERGLSGFDRRHVLNLSAFLTSPFGNGKTLHISNHFAATLLREWMITAGLTAQTGPPFTARVLGNAADTGGSGSTGSGRADATGLLIDAGSGFFNALAFAVPPAGRFGNAARNTIPGPSSLALNASLGRSFRVGKNDRHRLESRVSANNVINHVNITGFGTVVNALNYGWATSAGEMRSLDFSLRFRF